MKPKLNHERFSVWNEAYEAWKKEANPPHPDSVAFTEQGCAMKMVWLFAKWLYDAVENRNDSLKKHGRFKEAENDQQCYAKF